MGKYAEPLEFNGALTTTLFPLRILIVPVGDPFPELLVTFALKKRAYPYCCDPEYGTMVFVVGSNIVNWNDVALSSAATVIDTEADVLLPKVPSPA